VTTFILCAAVPQEITPLCRQLGLKTPSPAQPFSGPHSCQSNTFYALAPGVGGENMRNSLKTINLEGPAVWVSIGFAGALVPDLDPGACVFGSEVRNQQGQSLSFDLPASLEIELEDAFEDRPLICAQNMISTPGEKRELHKKTGGVLVDMESFHVAQHANRRGDRFFWLRVISDGLEETLHPRISETLNASGYPSALRFIKLFVTSRPADMKQLFHLARQSASRSKSLASALVEIIGSAAFDSIE